MSDAPEGSILRLARDIHVPARQNIGLRLDFYPFQPLMDGPTSRKYPYDDEGRFYRYVNGRPSFARVPGDVKDAPDSDWPERMRPRRGSKRGRRRYIMEDMRHMMGVTTSLRDRMQKLSGVLYKYAKELVDDGTIGDNTISGKLRRTRLAFDGPTTLTPLWYAATGEE